MWSRKPTGQICGAGCIGCWLPTRFILTGGIGRVVICFRVVRLFSTDPNLYLKLGRLGSADKEKVLGCCIFASPFFPRHLSPPALSGGRGWGDCVAGRVSCFAVRGSCVVSRGSDVLAASSSDVGRSCFHAENGGSLL